MRLKNANGTGCMKLYILILLTGVLFLNETHSQPPFRKSLETRSAGLVINMHWLQLNDAQFSPLSYSGPGVEISLSSVRSYDNIRRHLSIGASGDYLQNSFGFNAVYLRPEIVAGVTYLVNDISTENSLSYIGGSFSATSRMYRFLNEDPDHLYWATTYTLDFHYFFDMEVGEKRRALLELRFPIAGVASRPSDDYHYSFQLPGFGEYMKRLHENIGFSTWNTMQAVNATVLIDLSRTRRRSFSLGYELDFARFTRSEPVIYLSNSLFIRFFIDSLVW
jgi:hypothetical protein